MELCENEECMDEGGGEDARMHAYVERMSHFRDSLFADAKNSIVKSQSKQKRDYDKKHGRLTVRK